MKDIYTSYFAKTKRIPDTYALISIALYPPKGWDGLSYPKLAPTQKLLYEYRQNLNEEKYSDDYEKMLSKLKPMDVVADLKNLAGDKEIVLLCYEKPSDFCHRHLVADWLWNAGYSIEEYDY